MCVQSQPKYVPQSLFLHFALLAKVVCICQNYKMSKLDFFKT
jgi:hypothetical protein